MKIVALVPFDIYPPQFGGAQRCVKLLESVGPITVLGLNWLGDDRHETHGDVHYHLISARDKAKERAKKLFGQDLHTYDGMPAFCKSDLEHFQTYLDALEPDLIILEHPWLYPFVGDVPFIYDAHNAEAFLTSMRWPGSIDEQVTKELEHRVVTNAKAILYCSELDADVLRKYYNPTAPMHYVPNGTDLPETLAEGKTKNLIFVGSEYGPNIVAAQNLANMAYLLPDYTIQLIGGCGRHVRTTQPNVKLYGHVDDDTLDELHRNAFAFVNLIQTGSGTSLKVGRAMSYGLPIISTKTGARGYEGIVEVERGADITAAIAEVEKNWHTHAQASRKFAEKISWKRLGVKVYGVVHGA